MTSLMKLAPAVLALLSATPVLAQQTETETPAEPETSEAAEVETAPTEAAPAETEAEADPGSDLDLGTPVDQGPQPGQPYIASTFDDWSLRCINNPDAADPCQLYQLLTDQDGNAVAEMTMFALPPGGRAAAGATIVAPLETLLTEQLTISVDGSAARRYPFTFCNAGGCVSRVGFTEAEVSQFKRGSNATLRLVPAGAPDQEVILNVSLIGFTAALEATVGN